MKYILILGQNYRDCKAKSEEVAKFVEGKPTFVTKPIHVSGFEDCQAIETDAFANNPLREEIKARLKGQAAPMDFEPPITEAPPVEVIPPVVVQPIEEPVEESPVPLIDELPEVEDEPEVEPVIEEGVNILSDPEEPIIFENLESIVLEDEPVVEEEPEVEEEPVLEDEPVVEDEDIKPVNTPRGWHARNEFIDDAGNVFNKGQYVGKIEIL